MVSCAVKGCTNSSNKLVKMIRFPKKRPKVYDQWVTNCKNLGGLSENWSPSQYSALCEVSTSTIFGNQFRLSMFIFFI